MKIESKETITLTIDDPEVVEWLKQGKNWKFDYGHREYTDNALMKNLITLYDATVGEKWKTGVTPAYPSGTSK
ncbi:MAG: hypothetical protein ABF479_02135 [Gluconacetobacter sp.]